MSETALDLKIDGDIAHATFKTQNGLNVLSSRLLDLIDKMATQVKAAPHVRFLILGAEGKVFVAGANIKELSNLDATGAAELSNRGNRAFDAIADLPCITIARIHGAALGGGLEVAMACDFLVAVSSVKLGLPETSLGLVPGWKGMKRLSDRIGISTAKRIMFAADAVNGTEAHRLGLIDEIADDEAALDAAIEKLVTRCRRGGPHAISQIKQALKTGDETRAFAACFDHNESTDGISAFLEKRSASWME
ncbi:MAG: enoyl-CoA hydratase/isomerase family protein [Planctomycetes bacterium]|nr:enoyl-CoA hydratase/isomerase family protein [Planctomycetota bacterium]